jgi:hypothetical protein
MIPSVGESIMKRLGSISLAVICFSFSQVAQATDYQKIAEAEPWQWNGEHASLL